MVAGCNKRCRPHPRKKGTTYGLLCQAHYTKLRRKDNPVMAHYHRIKQQAKTRRIPFLITVMEWVGFCKATGYGMVWCNGFDNFAQRPSIDRKDGSGPYAIWNLQIMSFSENASKGNTERSMYISGRRVNTAAYVSNEPNEFL